AFRDHELPQLTPPEEIRRPRSHRQQGGRDPSAIYPPSQAGKWRKVRKSRMAAEVVKKYAEGNYREGNYREGNYGAVCITSPTSCRQQQTTAKQAQAIRDRRLERN
ncbi:hypothetical protein P7K49_006339, partial [Saguinus oedipus]